MSQCQGESLLVLLVPQLLELDRGQVVKRAVKTFVIVFLSPTLDEDPDFEK